MICHTCLIRIAVHGEKDCKLCRKNAARRSRRGVRCSNCGEPGGPGAAFDACQFTRKGEALLCPDCYSVPTPAPMEAA